MVQNSTGEAFFGKKPSAIGQPVVCIFTTQKNISSKNFIRWNTDLYKCRRESFYFPSPSAAIFIILALLEMPSSVLSETTRVLVRSKVAELTSTIFAALGEREG